MKTQFDTEKEAQEALRVARFESLGWCPVIKEACKGYLTEPKPCICYQEGGFKKDPFKDRYNIYYPYCINPLVWGVITVEN